ncbi:MAG: DNA recombination protein RmuC [Chitinophagales bacterium]|nr:DNA recombination protein RmuC [Chitinophagales bacterium]
MGTLYVLLAFIIGAVIGGAMLYFLLKSKSEGAIAGALERNAGLERSNAELKSEINTLRNKTEEANAALSASGNEIKNLNHRLQEQKAEVEQLHAKMQKDFELLANRILEEKSEKFVQRNDEQLKVILDPLKERLLQYEKRVNETHLDTERERSALREQLKQLTDINKRMSDETLNLTKALKGDNKMQGNWGEMILEKILEKSGLQKGQEYTVQQSFTNEDGSRSQPDVLIKLPEGKTLVVDSKVSLVAYERCVSAEDEVQKAQFLKEHIASLRNHVKLLSAKSYHQLYNIKSPDFVLLFIPIESAFALAVTADNELYNDAFDKNIIIVSTSTLLATLRTVANVWKQEYQSQNAIEIARQGADLYEKFVSFTEDLIKVGKQMDDSKKTYADAMNKLYDGKGNLIKRAENMRKLGLKVAKQLPQGLIDRSENEE